ncbi:O-antigen ligase domain-containing protein [Paenibacillus sp. SYP-B3998]|uniref:O-antigen ligase domain-containing protein n=1 Tax=Paenibacillus sp. SYP-B3998 TaxID=2678564 RepID=A0A6G4A5U4_9BACL|nr:O-antigen ligase family protein [Paenibacillus sp. SYP-B3998]NEW09314.1 O-antigen ligase domain-containing protein [Paenibacillus sp. SYP-B3998]
MQQPVKDAAAEVEKKSVIYWLIIGLLVFFLFWAPFQKGLFNGNSFDFERPIYSSVIWSSIFLFMLSIHLFFIWKLRDHRDTLCFLVLLIPLTYLISLIHAASQHYAVNMLYIQMIYITFFILGSFLMRNKLGYSIISGTLMASGYFIVIFGLLNWFGNARFAGALVGWFTDINGVYNQAVMNDSNGIRLTSVFQYANSYAAYLIAILLASTFYVVKSRKWYAIAVHAFMMLLVIISFWLTLSRGAIVILPAVLLIILVFQNLQKQTLMLIHLGLAFIVSLVILAKITDIGVQLESQFSLSLSWQGWIWLLVASASFAILSVLIQLFLAPILDKKLQRFAGRKFTNIILPMTAIILGLIGAVLIFSDTGFKNLLPSNIQTRLQSINFAQHSVLERGTFYMDAIKLWKDYPILGAGGGAWAALYEKYQNNPYVSRQAHNFFLQYLVEVGILGVLVLLVFIASILLFYIKSYFKASQEKRDQYFVFFIFTLSLLSHSSIDFDLSYVYLGTLLFLSLGGMLAFTEPVPIKLKTENWVFHKTYPALILLLSIALFFTSVRLLSSNSSFDTYLKMIGKNQNYNEIAVPLNSAIKLSPNHPDYIMGFSSGSMFIPGKVTILDQLYRQTKDEQFYSESESLILSLKQKEPHNRLLVMGQLTHFQMKGQLEEALTLVNSELPNFPWQISLYEMGISLAADLGIQAKADGKAQNSSKYWNNALELHQTVLNRMELLKSLPKEQNQGQQFGVTKQMSISLGEIYFMRGEFQNSIAFLKPILTDQLDDQLNRLAARYYLAALNMQKQNDQALFEKLVAKDPTEQQQIEALISSANVSR